MVIFWHKEDSQGQILQHDRVHEQVLRLRHRRGPGECTFQHQTGHQGVSRGTRPLSLADISQRFRFFVTELRQSSTKRLTSWTRCDATDDVAAEQVLRLRHRRGPGERTLSPAVRLNSSPKHSEFHTTCLHDEVGGRSALVRAGWLTPHGFQHFPASRCPGPVRFQAS